MKIDVAIIGTGPAGSMAARRLAHTGLRVEVLEKATLPRPKPCGGGMPVVVQDLLEDDWSHLVEARPHQVKHIFNYGVSQTHIYEHGILMIDRRRFDSYLIEQALARGRGSIRLREGFEVTAVEEDSKGVTIRGKGEEIVRASYLIAGDGAFSPTAKYLGLAPKARPGIALDAEVEVAPDVFEAERDVATFNFGCVPGGTGYAWIFPKDGYLTCGIGSWRGKPKLQRALDTFLERSFPAGSIRSVHRAGHPIPLYAGPRPVATPRVCLVGDAAGLVDPVMGEGIRFAMQSGTIAADVIGELFDASASVPPADCHVYAERVHRQIGHEFDLLYRFITPLYFANPRFFYRKFFFEGSNYHLLARQLDAKKRRGSEREKLSVRG